MECDLTNNTTFDYIAMIEIAFTVLYFVEDSVLMFPITLLDRSSRSGFLTSYQ